MTKEALWWKLYWASSERVVYYFFSFLFLQSKVFPSGPSVELWNQTILFIILVTSYCHFLTVVHGLNNINTVPQHECHSTLKISKNNNKKISGLPQNICIEIQFLCKTTSWVHSKSMVILEGGLKPGAKLFFLKHKGAGTIMCNRFLIKYRSEPIVVKVSTRAMWQDSCLAVN